MIKLGLFLLMWHGAALQQHIRTIDVETAIALVAGTPAMRSELRALVLSESKGYAIGVHAKVNPSLRRRSGAQAWRRAVARGWLSPETCPAHRLDVEDEAGEAWGPRGVAGQIAAFAVRRVAPCVPPSVLDIPIVALRAARAQIEDLRKVYRFETAAERALAWRRGIGAARRLRKSPEAV